MLDELSQAVLADASPEEIMDCEPPRRTLALCVRRAEETMFDGLAEADIDIRRSLHVEEVPLPELAPDEVLVATMASAINYNTVWSAMFRPVSTFRFLERLPYQEPAERGKRHCIDQHILGSDGAGVVVRVGTEVQHWKVGDHVTLQGLFPDVQEPRTHTDGLLSENQRAWGYETNFGGLAHFSIVKGIQLLPKPPHLSWEEAACSSACLGTAYRMLIGPHGSRVKLGDLVLVWGATGGLGAYGVQLAKAAGCEVVAVVSSERKIRLAEELGCDLVVDRRELSGSNPAGLRSLDVCRTLRKLIRIRFGRDPDHIFEHVGRETFGASVFLAARGGSVVTCGSSTGYQHEYDNRHLWMKVKRIIGSHAANYGEAEAAARLIDTGVVAPALSDVFPLSEAPQAARLVHEGRHVGKVGVLCLAQAAGQGVTEPARRATLPKDRLELFRDFARSVASEDGAASSDPELSDAR